MTTQLYYRYDSVTHEYLSEGVADESPADANARALENTARAYRNRVKDERRAELIKQAELLGTEPDTSSIEQNEPMLEASVFHYPAYCTLIQPPTFNLGQRPVFEPISETWVVVPDFRDVRLFDVRNGEQLPSLELGQPLPPDNDTFTSVTPPALEPGSCAKFVSGTWVIIPDHRGKTAYNKQTLEPVTITEIGDPPDELTLLPPGVDVRWDSQSGSWTPDPEKVRQTNVARVKQELQLNDELSIRAVRELLLSPGNTDAMTKLRQCDEQAAGLRRQLASYT